MSLCTLSRPTSPLTCVRARDARPGACVNGQGGCKSVQNVRAHPEAACRYARRLTPAQQMKAEMTRQAGHVDEADPADTAFARLAVDLGLAPQWAGPIRRRTNAAVPRPARGSRGIGKCGARTFFDCEPATDWSAAPTPLGPSHGSAPAGNAKPESRPFIAIP